MDGITQHGLDFILSCCQWGWNSNYQQKWRVSKTVSVYVIAEESLETLIRHENVGSFESDWIALRIGWSHKHTEREGAFETAIGTLPNEKGKKITKISNGGRGKMGDALWPNLKRIIYPLIRNKWWVMSPCSLLVKWSNVWALWFFKGRFIAQDEGKVLQKSTIKKRHDLIHFDFYCTAERAREREVGESRHWYLNIWNIQLKCCCSI